MNLNKTYRISLIVSSGVLFSGLILGILNFTKEEPAEDEKMFMENYFPKEKIIEREALLNDPALLIDPVSSSDVKIPVEIFDSDLEQTMEEIKGEKVLPSERQLNLVRSIKQDFQYIRDRQLTDGLTAEDRIVIHALSERRNLRTKSQ